MEGALDDHFPIDIFQTGSGTSTNTNANEVIARRAAGAARRDRRPPGPSQRPCQLRAVIQRRDPHRHPCRRRRRGLRGPGSRAEGAGRGAAGQGRGVRRRGQVGEDPPDGRHPGDSRPGVRRLRNTDSARVQSVSARCCPSSRNCPFGGTAVGPVSTPRRASPQAVIGLLAERTGLAIPRGGRPLRGASGKGRHGDGIGSDQDGGRVACSRSPTTCAGSARAPTSGIAEIRLPDLQPGSSIMPGKVNPVIPEMVMQVAAQVVGNDATVTWAAANGNFELNVMMPVLAAQPAAVDRVAGRGGFRSPQPVRGGDHSRRGASPRAGRAKRHRRHRAQPHIGYDNGAMVAKEALATGRSVRDVVLDKWPLLSRTSSMPSST